MWYRLSRSFTNWGTPRNVFSPLIIWDLSFPICPKEAFFTELPKGPPMSTPEDTGRDGFVKIGPHTQAEGVGDNLLQRVVTGKLVSAHASSRSLGHPGPDYIWA